MNSKTTVLLGSGFTGQFLAERFSAESIHFIQTSRTKNGFVRFDLNDESTWKNIPIEADIVWLFPAEPIQKVKEFSSNRNVKIVLGTTSSYKEKSGIIDENSELDLSAARVEGEEYLRSIGTTVLRCSGIYGNERHPYNWLKNGLIKNGNKSVNLIHATDLSEIIFRILKSPIQGEVFTISDGEKYVWNEIVENGKKSSLLNQDFTLPQGESGEKFVNNEKLKLFMGGEYEFKKLF